MKVVVLHHVNGATKTVELEAYRFSTALVAAGIAVELFDSGGAKTGLGMFHTGGLVLLGGDAIGQYPEWVTAGPADVAP